MVCASIIVCTARYTTLFDTKEQDNMKVFIAHVFITHNKQHKKPHIFEGKGKSWMYTTTVIYNDNVYTTCKHSFLIQGCGLNLYMYCLRI